MSSVKRRNLTLILIVLGCITYCTFEAFHLLDNTPKHEVFNLNMRQTLLSQIGLCFFTAVIMMVYQTKNELLPLVWALSYFAGAKIFWYQTKEEIAALIPFAMTCVLLFIILLDLTLKIRDRAFAVGTRFLWLIALCVHIGLGVYHVFRTPGYSVASNVYNVAWGLMVFVSMAETMPVLRLFRRFAEWLGILASVLFGTYMLFPAGNLPVENTGSNVWHNMPAVLFALTTLLYVFWLHKAVPSKQRVRPGKFFLITQFGGMLGIVLLFGFWHFY